jgi:opine dehydrogenase
MKIAVLGGGHGAYAAAADPLASRPRGGAVAARRRRAGAGRPARQHRPEGRAGHARGAARLATADIGAAVQGAELIVVPSPATAQADIAAGLGPHLVDGQVVFLAPGTFGTFAMAEAVRRAGNAARVDWAETGTLPYLARKHGPREVNLTVRAVRLPTTPRSPSSGAPIRACTPAATPCRARS